MLTFFNIFTSDIVGFVEKLDDIVGGTALIVLLLSAGLYFTIRTKGVQVRKVKTMAILLFSGGSSEKGVSSFQAFALSVAGRVGTGNIAGVATAIAFGGPGALFWMWVIAIFGSASAYIESTLAQIYKEEIDGEYRGGPAYYFEKITGKRIFGVIFAILTLISIGICLPSVQANSIASAMYNGFGSESMNPDTFKLIVGIVVAVILGIVIFGGTKRLGRVAEVVVPFMSIAYMIIAIVIIVVNIQILPETFALIFKSAFTPMAGLGGVLGTAIINGVKRGIFSNEAGQGTGPHAAAAAVVNHPAEQGLVQSFSVYFDTLLVCTATGLMIIITDSYNLFTKAGELVYSGNNIAGSIGAGPAFTQAAVGTIFGDLGVKFVAIALFFFAFTTLMAYYYMTESNIAYLTEKKDKKGVEHSNHKLIIILRFVFLAIVVLFSTTSSGLVWEIADVGVGIMAWYNVIGILIIASPAIIALKDYEKQQKAGVEKPKFSPKELGIKNVDETVWKD